MGDMMYVRLIRMTDTIFIFIEGLEAALKLMREGDINKIWEILEKGMAYALYYTFLFAF